MMDIDESSLPMAFVKEEKVDDDDFFNDKKFETPKRGRSRSLSKKNAEKVDIKAKLERSRQSARECRARKKLRYQYLEELISETEKAIFALRREMEMLKIWSKELEEGQVADQLLQYRQACIDKTPTDPLKLKPRGSDSSQHQGIAIAGVSGFSNANTSAALSVSPSGDMTSFMTLMNINNTHQQSNSLSPP